MSKGIMPSDPPRADHRLIKYVVETFYGKKGVQSDPREFDKVSNVYALMGGSWERLFKGSAKEINLLKKIVKIAIEKGVISKKPKWR